MLMAVLIVLPVLGGGWLWLRESPFVAVQRVEISGVRGPEAAEIKTALVAAARQMSTLDVHTGALRAATASFPVVREVRALPRFPHALDVEVVEQLPVAALVVGGTRTAVAADGVVLGPALLKGSLPTVSGYFEPGVGRHLHAPNLVAALSVLGAAPAPLARQVERVFTGGKGLTVAMRNGLLAYFGDATRPHAKWLSLARVLADSSSAGASYIDVRLPARPAAGFPAGVLPPDASAAVAAGSAEQTGATESTVASLAAGLTAGTGVEPASTSSGSSASEPASETAGEPASETASGAAAESEASTQAETAPSSPATGG
jgi:cell division protein FtsQ